MKIYTRTGDSGTTSLSDGTRVSKDDALLHAYGTIDELNAFVGVLISEENETFLSEIQQMLFVLGGMLATPVSNWEKYWKSVDLDAFVARTESEIDTLSADLQPLKGFILPQGNRAIADTHVCRTVCRRAERAIVSLLPLSPTFSKVQIVLNRLSDYFFILARYLHKKYGVMETYYKSAK